MSPQITASQTNTAQHASPNEGRATRAAYTVQAPRMPEYSQPRGQSGLVNGTIASLRAMPNPGRQPCTLALELPHPLARPGQQGLSALQKPHIPFTQPGYTTQTPALDLLQGPMHRYLFQGPVYRHQMGGTLQSKC